MAKKEIKDQLESYEGYINDIIDPCKMCKVYKANNRYETGHYNSLGLFENGTCTECCWCYNSKFEVAE